MIVTSRNAFVPHLIASEYSKSIYIAARRLDRIQLMFRNLVNKDNAILILALPGTYPEISPSQNVKLAPTTISRSHRLQCLKFDDQKGVQQVSVEIPNEKH